MFKFDFANIILIFHFFIVIFITIQFFSIPIAYKLNWKWQKNKRLRFIHLFLIFIITVETIIGITCPLTLIENNLRDIQSSEGFISTWIRNILYWNLPTSFFLITYLICFIWTLLMWKFFPPISKDKNNRV